MSTKKTNNNKTVNTKKDELASKINDKKTSNTVKNTGAPKKSSVVKKELTPINIDNSLRNKKKDTKKIVEKDTEKKASAIKERPSVTLLREALKSAKTKVETDGVATKAVSKKYSTLVKEELGKKKEDKIDIEKVEKTTYSKKDLIRPKNVKTTPVILDETNEKKEERKTDKPINIAASDDLSDTTKNQAVEDEKSFNDSKNAILGMMNKNKLRESEKELLRQIEEKSRPKAVPLENLKTNTPVEPYVYRTMMKKKKSKTPFIAIIGVLAIIFGLTFTAIQFINKDEYNIEVIVDSTVTENTENMLTNDNSSIAEETQTIEENLEIKSNSENEITETINIVEPNKIDIIEKPIIEESKTVVIITNEIEKAPEAPKPPVAPTFEPPSYGNTLAPPNSQKVYIIKWQDTMQSIALNELGDANRWPTIYSINKNSLKSPDFFNFGDQLNLPTNSKSIAEMTQAEKKSLYNDYIITIEAYKALGKDNLANAIQSTANMLR